MNWYGLHISKPKKVEEKTPLTALSFFLGNPRGYKFKAWDPQAVENFKTSLKLCSNLTPDQIPIHGCYLINLASPKPDVIPKSRERLLAELTTCRELGITRYVLHPGFTPNPAEGLKQLGDHLKEILPQFPTVNILIENMTGTNKLGQTFEQIRDLLLYVSEPNLKVCLDTAHSWGAGMNMNTLLDDFDRIIGLEYLWAIHLNDSKAEFGGNRDLHQNIFEGNIPRNFWYDFVLDPRIQNIPCILETPVNNHPRLQVFMNFIKFMNSIHVPLPLSKTMWNYVNY